MLAIGGGTSSGKTNLLNAIARVSDPRELDLVVPDRANLVTVNNRDPDRAVTQRHLVANALRILFGGEFFASTYETAAVLSGALANWAAMRFDFDGRAILRRARALGGASVRIHSARCAR